MEKKNRNKGESNFKDRGKGRNQRGQRGGYQGRGMSRGTKVRPKSLRKAPKVLLEEVIVEEGVTKEALIEKED